MDNKMQALEKAQEMQREKIKAGETYVALQHYNESHYFNVEWTSGHKVFKFSDPKPLERDTQCMCGDGIIRYAMGELCEKGINKFYAPGFCSKNIRKGYTHTVFKNFEIIETPGEFERMQTPDGQCVSFGCSRYVNKWQRVESDKFLNGDCERCRIPIGTPSKLQVKK